MEASSEASASPFYKAEVVLVLSCALPYFPHCITCFLSKHMLQMMAFPSNQSFISLL